MEVSRNGPDFFQVTEGPAGRDKWWTARFFPHNNTWHIENRRGEHVQPAGRLGLRIIKAICAHAPEMRMP